MKKIIFLIMLFISFNNFCQTYKVDNINITNNSEEQYETAIAVNPNNPNHLFATWMDFSDGVNNKPGYGISTDGGITWSNNLIPLPTGLTRGADPSCIFDLNNNLYYSYMAYIPSRFPYVANSTNNGIDWNNIEVSNHSYIDKPYISFDPEINRFYLAYILLTGESNEVYFTYSDNASNWQGLQKLDEVLDNYLLPEFINEYTSFSYFAGTVPAVSPNGDVYVVWLQGEQYNDSGSSIRIRRSTDNGISFEPLIIAAPNIRVSTNQKFGALRNYSNPTIAFKPDGDICIVFVQKDIGEDLNIYYIISEDDGENWTSPEIATELTSGHQLFPWLSTDSNGNIHLAYYNLEDWELNVYVSELFKDENSFYLHDYKITNFTNSISDPRNCNLCSNNDYLGITSSVGNRVFPIWTDYRDNNPEVYIAKYESDLRFAYENKSLDHTATSLNGQRKLVKDNAGNYHIVFTSGGEIFYRKSTNNGNSWQAPVRLSDGTGENKFPSITTMDNYLYITWQQYLGLDGSQHKYKIKGMYTSMTGWSPMTINDDEVYFSSPTDPLPVIVAAENIDNNYSSTDGLPEVMIAYRNSDGIYHINLFAWTPDSQIYYYSQQGSVHKIPNTSTGYRNSSITVNGLGEILLTCDYMGNIYAFLTAGGSWSAISSSIFQSAYISSSTKSSVTSDALNYFHISWQGENWVYQTNSILHKRISTSGGIGTPITEFRNNQYMSFQPSTFGHLDTNGGVTLYWYTGDDLDIKKVINDGTRWDHSSTEFIPSIQTNARFVNSIDKDLPYDFAYFWTSAGDAPYDCNTCIGCEENQDDFGDADSLETFRRAEFSNSALDAILSLQLGNFQLKDINNNSYPLEPEELDANFTFQNFSDVLNVLFSDSIPRSNLYKKIAFEYEAVIKNLSKIKAINTNDVSLKLKLIDRTTGNTLYTSDSYTLPLDSIKRTISGNLTIPFNRLNQRYDLSVKLILEGVAEEYFNQTENINLVNTYLSCSEYLGKENKTKNNISPLTDYKLEQNYPNPFNPSTQIKYSIANNGFVAMKIYDILGREVEVLVNEEKQEGTYTINFNASHLSSGIYFYQVKANNFIDTKKMILLR